MRTGLFCMLVISSLLISCAHNSHHSAEVSSAATDTSRKIATDNRDEAMFTVSLSSYAMKNWSIPYRKNSFTVRVGDTVGYDNHFFIVNAIDTENGRAKGTAKYASSVYTVGQAAEMNLNDVTPEGCYVETGFFLCTGVKIRNVNGDEYVLNSVLANGLAHMTMEKDGKSSTSILHLDNIQVTPESYVKERLFFPTELQKQRQIGNEWNHSPVWN